MKIFCSTIPLVRRLPPPFLVIVVAAVAVISVCKEQQEELTISMLDLCTWALGHELKVFRK